MFYRSSQETLLKFFLTKSLKKSTCELPSAQRWATNWDIWFRGKKSLIHSCEKKSSTPLIYSPELFIRGRILRFLIDTLPIDRLRIFLVAPKVYTS